MKTTREILDDAYEAYLKTREFCTVKTVGDSLEQCPKCPCEKLCEGIRYLICWSFSTVEVDVCDKKI